MNFLRVVALGFVLLSGIFTAFVSQTSSPDYQHLYWSILPVAAVHLSLSGVYVARVRHWTRFIALVVAVVTLGFLTEMTF